MHISDFASSLLVCVPPVEIVTLRHDPQSKCKNENLGRSSGFIAADTTCNESLFLFASFGFFDSVAMIAPGKSWGFVMSFTSPGLLCGFILIPRPLVFRDAIGRAVLPTSAIGLIVIGALIAGVRFTNGVNVVIVGESALRLLLSIINTC